jgi:bacillithiol biosynthesis cysteine-adding enzyme BshC
MGSTFFAAWLRGDGAAGALLPTGCTSEAAWARAASEGGRRRVSGPLLAELHRQSALLPPSEARARNLALLEGTGPGEGVSVVVTGQQVGLFLGPLYTLHKAATAVTRARLVTEQTGRPCIPLFWLQTEDHDYAEIASATVLAPGGPRALSLPVESAGEQRVSLAERLLPPETRGLVAELSALLAPLRHGAEVSAFVEKHYQPGRSPGAAFGGLLAELFSEEGLVVFDPRTEAVSRLAAPVIRAALGRHEEVAQALAQRAAQLAAAGFEEQVRTRPEASLVFFHPRGAAGPRHRLVREGEGEWSTPEGRISQAALLARLEAEPLACSTSALLRPLVQDTLLPTCAYLGGPAECTYFAQLAPLYALLGVQQPLIAPRARLQLVDESAAALLGKLGLEEPDLDLGRDALLARLVQRPEGLPAAAALREELLGPLTRGLARLERLAPSLDGSLAGPLQKTRESATGAVERLLERIEKAAAARDTVVVERLDRLLQMLRPGGAPQERVYAFPQVAARVGPRALVSALVAAASPLSPEPRSVRL